MEFIVPAAVILVVVVGFFLVLKSVFKLYVKVPPNKAAIFYGRKSKTDGGQLIGAKVVSGGGKFRIPLIEAVEWLDLSTMSMDLEVKDIPNIHGVPVSIKGVANVKIKSDDVSLAAAAERFLGKQQSEVKAIVLDNLHGHLRAILGKMSIEDLIRDREKFNSSVLSEAGEDLGKMGMQVDILKIQDIKDSLGYIEALGKPQTALVKADAKMKEAERMSEADQRTAEFNQTARTVEAQNAAKIAEAEKDRDVKKATYIADVRSEEARAEQAGPLATAQAKQAVITEETQVANKEASRREAQLLAEVVKPAEAAKRKVVVDAEASKAQVVLAAEAVREQKRLEGEGEQARLTAVGEGEAAAIRAKLLAEAEGVLKKAEAYQKLDASGRVLLILEKLPEVLDKLAPVFGAIAAPMGNIDEVKIFDFGGDGKGPAKFAGNVSQLLFSLFEQFKGLGLDGDLTKMLEKIKAPTTPASDDAGSGESKK